MSLFIVDTDILTLFRAHHPVVVWQVIAHLGEDIAISSISVEESVNGWLNVIRTSRRPDQVARGHRELAETIPFLAAWIILPYTEAANTRFVQLRGMRLNVGSQDLRIAAVALETDATVVTRNLRDFQRVPKLRVENWAA